MKFKIIGGLIILFAILPFIELKLTQQGGWADSIIPGGEARLDTSLNILNSLRKHSVDFLIDKESLSLFSLGKYNENGYFNCAGNLTYGRELICTSDALEILHNLDQMNKITLSKREAIIDYADKTFKLNSERGWFGAEQVYSYVAIYHFLNETLPQVNEIQAILSKSKASDNGYASFQDPLIGDVRSTNFALKTLKLYNQNFTDSRVSYINFLSQKMNSLGIKDLVLAYDSLNMLNVPFDVSLKNKLYCIADFFNPFSNPSSKAVCLDLLKAGNINIFVPVIMFIIFGIILMYL